MMMYLNVFCWNLVFGYKADFISQLKCFTNHNSIILFHVELNEVSYKKYSGRRKEKKLKWVETKTLFTIVF
jgi:hypothetical protein